MKASNAESYDRFGSAVAISGNTVVVGARHEDSNSTIINGDQNDNTGYEHGTGLLLTALNHCVFDRNTGCLHVIATGSSNAWHAIDPQSGARVELAGITGCGSSCRQYTAIAIPHSVAPVGNTYCGPANFNSTGRSTGLEGRRLTGGGIGGGQTDLHLECTRGVPGEFGYLLVGFSRSDPPLIVGGGLFCVTGSGFYRYNVANTPANSVGVFDASGILVNTVGTSSVGPSGRETGFDVPDLMVGSMMAITAGSTWHFQVWHRDSPAGPGHSNFSNALSVNF